MNIKNLAAKFFDKTFWKFIIVGIINTLFGTAVMFVFYNVFNFSYWISSASNYILGSILSYFLNKYFTFKSQDNSPKSILKFAINITVCYLVAYGGAKPLMALILSGFSQSLRDNAAMLLGMGLFVILNYCGQRFFVFNKNENKEEVQE